MKSTFKWQRWHLLLTMALLSILGSIRHKDPVSKEAVQTIRISKRACESRESSCWVSYHSASGSEATAKVQKSLRIQIDLPKAAFQEGEQGLERKNGVLVAGVAVCRCRDALRPCQQIQLRASGIWGDPWELACSNFRSRKCRWAGSSALR